MATALREASEEINLASESVCVLAIMPPMLSKHFLSVSDQSIVFALLDKLAYAESMAGDWWQVTSVIAGIPAGIPLKPNQAEVAQIFDVVSPRPLQIGRCQVGCTPPHNSACNSVASPCMLILHSPG